MAQLLHHHHHHWFKASDSNVAGQRWGGRRRRRRRSWVPGGGREPAPAPAPAPAPGPAGAGDELRLHDPSSLCGSERSFLPSAPQGHHCTRDIGHRAGGTQQGQNGGLGGSGGFCGVFVGFLLRGNRGGKGDPRIQGHLPKTSHSFCPTTPAWPRDLLHTGRGPAPASGSPLT